MRTTCRRHRSSARSRADERISVGASGAQRKKPHTRRLRVGRSRCGLAFNVKFGVPGLIAQACTVPAAKLGDHVGVIDGDAGALLLALALLADLCLCPLHLLDALGDGLP